MKCKLYRPDGVDNVFRYIAAGIFSVLLLLQLTSCGVPKSMQVRSGVDPRYQDDNVRFRTTYYFRVFDEKSRTPNIDSLYRFRMTGKASSIFNEVHFESGTLKQWEIEPFGSNLQYDKQLGSFRFISHRKIEEQADRNARYQEIRRRIELLNSVNNMLPKQDKQSKNNDTIQSIRKKIVKSVQKLIESIDTPLAKQVFPGSESSKKAAEPEIPGRGFQIFGPEGFHTFNQDDRLIMAMRSSGKPLIGTLQELADRVLNEQPAEAEVLLPLVQERLLITRAERQLDQIEHTPSTKSKDIVVQILDIFSSK